MEQRLHPWFSFELSTTIQSIYPFQPQPVDKYVGSPYMIYTKWDAWLQEQSKWSYKTTYLR